MPREAKHHSSQQSNLKELPYVVFIFQTMIESPNMHNQERSLIATKNS